MSDRLPFQYSVLRYVHDMVTGEFLNVGLAVYSPSAKYFKARVLPTYSRITDTFPGAEGEYYRRYATQLQRTLDGLSRRIGQDQLALFGSSSNELGTLLATVLPLDEASIRFGDPKGGMTEDLNGVFDELFERLVERYLRQPERPSRTDDEVWHFYRKPLQELDVVERLRPHAIHTRVEVFEFDHAWRNGAWNVLQPVSFDLMQVGSVRAKARQWLGATIFLEGSPDLSHLYMLLGRPRTPKPELTRAYGDAKTILSERANGRIRLIEEDEAEDFAREIKPLIEQHQDT